MFAIITFIIIFIPVFTMSLSLGSTIRPLLLLNHSPISYAIRLLPLSQSRAPVGLAALLRRSTAATLPGCIVFAAPQSHSPVGYAAR